MKVNIGKFPKGNGNRRINVQIDNFDVWSMDHTLALIIYPALVQLREVQHGIPNEFGDVGGANHEMQESFDFYTESYDEAFNAGCEKWAQVLDKMIWSFEQILKGDYDAKYHHGTPEFDWIESDKQYPNPVTGKMEPTYQMVDKNPDEHWYDSVGHILHEERIQEGLELFGKYYRNLWD